MEKVISGIGFSAITSIAKFTYSNILIFFLLPFVPYALVNEVLIVMAQFNLMFLIMDFGYSVSLSHRKSYDEFAIKILKFFSCLIVVTLSAIFFDISLVILLAAACFNIAIFMVQKEKGHLNFKTEAYFYGVYAFLLSSLICALIYYELSVEYAYLISAMILVGLFGQPYLTITKRDVGQARSIIFSESRKQIQYGIYSIAMFGGVAIEMLIANMFFSGAVFTEFGILQRWLVISLAALPILFNVLLPLVRRADALAMRDLVRFFALSILLALMLSFFCIVYLMVATDVNMNVSQMMVVLALKLSAAWLGFLLLIKLPPAIRSLAVIVQIGSLFLYARYIGIAEPIAFLQLSAFKLVIVYLVILGVYYGFSQHHNTRI